ncbi:MAG: leucine-rich repeat protein [Clostridia bacterium]|nr:leucine-rich repeat protein [Clostridia bacterium]
MNGDSLYDALSHVGADLIDRARKTPPDPPKKPSRPISRRLAAIAGCACLLLVGAILFAHFFPGPGSNVSASGLTLMAVDADEMDLDELNAKIGYTHWTERNDYCDPAQPGTVEIEILGETVSGTYVRSFYRYGSLVPFHTYRVEDGSEFDIEPHGKLTQYSWAPMTASERRDAGERISDEEAVAVARDLFERLTPYQADDYSVDVAAYSETLEVIEIFFHKEMAGIPTADWARIYLYKNGRPMTFSSCALGTIPKNGYRYFDYDAIDREVVEYCNKQGLINLIQSLDDSVSDLDETAFVSVDFCDWTHMITADKYEGETYVIVSVRIRYETVRDGNAEESRIALTFVSPSGKIHAIPSDPATPAKEIVEPSEGLTYASNGDGTCSVTGIGTFTGKQLVIPDTSPDGDTVTSVADNAFCGVDTIRSVVLPDTVKSIGTNSFAACTLSEIDFGNGVEYIGPSAFNSANYLTSVYIPDSVKTIDHGAFCWCIRLKNVSIGNGLITLEQQAFAYSPGVLYTEYENGLYLGNRSNPYSVLIDVADDTCTSIAIHPDTKTLGFGAFSGCSNLTSVILPAGLTSIGKYAFNCCFSLTEITIPATVTTIGIEAFNTCPSLTAVTFEYDGEWTLRYPEDWIERDPDTFGVEITFTSGTPEENAHDLTYSYIHQSWTKN